MHLFFVCLFVCLFVCCFVVLFVVFVCLVADLDGQVHSAQHVFPPLDVVSIHEWWNLVGIVHSLLYLGTFVVLFHYYKCALVHVHYFFSTCENPLH